MLLPDSAAPPQPIPQVMDPDLDATTRIFAALVRVRYAALVDGLQEVADVAEKELLKMVKDSDPGRPPGAGAAEVLWAASAALAACMELTQRPKVERLELGLRIMRPTRSDEVKRAVRVFQEGVGNDDFDKTNRLRTGAWPWPRPHFVMDKEIEDDIREPAAYAKSEPSCSNAPPTLTPTHLPDDEEATGGVSPLAEPPVLREANQVGMLHFPPMKN